MQLPYAVSPPTWSSNGLYSLNTRPFLALHRRKYPRLPRLFPVSVTATQLHPPVDSPAHLPLCHPRTRQGRQLSFAGDSGVDSVARSPLQTSGMAAAPTCRGEDERDDESKGVGDGAAEGSKTGVVLRGELRGSAADAARRLACAGVEETSECCGEEELGPLGNRKRHVRRLLSNAESISGPNGGCNSALAFDPDAYPSRTWARLGTGNPLAVIRIGQDYSLVCAMSGTLSSVAVYDVRSTQRDKDGEDQRLFRRTGLTPATGARVDDGVPITDLVTVDWEAESCEPCRLLATTSMSISFGHFSTPHMGSVIEWDATLPIPHPLSSCLNPLYPEEFATICEEGLYVGTCSQYSAATKHDAWPASDCFHDIQSVEKQTRYNRVCYGVHPRSLLLSNRREIVRFDARRKIDINSKDVLVNPKEDWNLATYDSGLAIFQPMRARSHKMLVVTQTCMNYIDARMPHTPLLDWSLSLPMAVERACVASLDRCTPASDVIALASRPQCYLEVFHGLHDQGGSAAGFLGCRPENGRKLRLPPVARPEMVWSDLPLAHLQQLTGASHVSGMVLLPDADERRLSLAQWSRTDGLLSQELVMEARRDGECAFEAETDERVGTDSAINMLNFQKRLLECGLLEGQPWMHHPVTGCKTGAALHSACRRVFLGDANEVRKRIVRGEDEVGDGIRLPRPFLSDVKKVVEIRQADNALLTAGGASEEAPPGGPRLVRPPAPTDSPIAKRRRHANGDMEVGTVAERAAFWPASSTSSSDSDAGHSDDDSLPAALSRSGGATLDELGRVARSGMAHGATPLGCDGLRAAVEGGGLSGVQWHDMEWHAGCAVEEHADGTAVRVVGEARDTGNAKAGVPDWVCRRVYRREREDMDEAELAGGYAALVERMREEFELTNRGEAGEERVALNAKLDDAL